jgi:hypothetical protein
MILVERILFIPFLVKMPGSLQQGLKKNTRFSTNTALPFSLIFPV